MYELKTNISESKLKPVLIDKASKVSFFLLKRSAMYSKFVAFLLISLFSFAPLAAKENNPPSAKEIWLWKIDGKKTTLHQFNQAYEHFLYMVAQRTNISVKELKEYILDPESAPGSLQPYLPGLTKKSYAGQYKRMILVNLQAQSEKYSEQKEISNLLKFLTKYYTVDSYVHEKIKPETFSISDEEALEQFIEIRKHDPAYKNIPIDQGIEIVKKQLLSQEFSLAQKKLLDQITASMSFEFNPAYPIETYLTQDETAPQRPNEWLWKINNQKITAAKAGHAYESYLLMTSQQFQYSPEELKAFMKTPESAPPEVQPYLEALSKETFLKQYKELLLLYAGAQKEGYNKQKKTKDRNRFIHEFYIAHLFVMIKIAPQTIEVTDEEAIQTWEKLQKTNPAFKKVLLSEALPIIKKQLHKQKLQKRNNTLINEIKQKFPSQENRGFDQERYLNQSP